MKTKTLPRRTFLRGLGGAALALPALEIMTPTARAADGAIPKRFVMSFGGMSTGRSNFPAEVEPSDTGTGYATTLGLSGLVDQGVKDDVTVVSGLTIPWGSGGSIPAGGRAVQFHFNTTTPQIAGTKALEPQQGPSGPTADQLVADAIGGDTTFDVLAYRVQVSAYWTANGSGGNMGRLSWRRDNAGEIVPVDPIVSPRAAYDALFANFVPDDPAEAAALAEARARRLSVLDLVKDNTERLLSTVGRADQIRLEQHFDEVRELEEQIRAMPPSLTGACEQLPDPGEDPPPGGASFNGDEYLPNGGYSGENERAEVLSSLIAMAFACDLSRVASYMLTMWKCYMNVKPILDGLEGDMHGLTHGTYGSPEGAARGFNWHVDHFARLVRKLRDTPEVDGGSLLDHTALVMLFEGGHGYDPQTDKDNSPHSTENMISLVAGRAGGLVPAGHIRLPGEHPGRLVTSAMDAVGVAPELGDLSGTIPQLFGA